MIHCRFDDGWIIPPVFIGKILEAQALLEQHSIPYRLLGSIATFGHLYDKAIGWPDFNRSRFLPGHQRVPDLDILVRRCDLPISQQIRRKMLLDPHYPVNVELLSGICHYDWRPDESLSYVVHRDLRVPFASASFNRSVVKIENAVINTIGHRALLHTYVTMGATLRERDRERVRALARVGRDDSSCGPAFWPFHRFIQIRQDEYRGYILSRIIGERLRTTLPATPYYWIVNIGKRFQPLFFGAKIG
jgi:hypothetical protein